MDTIVAYTAQWHVARDAGRFLLRLEHGGEIELRVASAAEFDAVRALLRDDPHPRYDAETSSVTGSLRRPGA